MFDRKKYEKLGCPEKFISICEAMTKEERRDWYLVVNAAGEGNSAAVAMLKERFGAEPSMYNVHNISTMLIDEYTDRELDVLSRKWERELDLMAKMGQWIPDRYIRKMEEEALPKLLYYRMRAGMTQKELAAKAGTNVMQISRIERGIIKLKNMSLSNAAALAAALGITAEELL